MNTEHPVIRDERIVAVENAAFEWAYYLLAWPLVIDALYRQKVRNEEVGDLIALVCVSSAIALVYLIWHKALVWYWPWTWGKTATVFAVSFVAAILISILAVLSVVFP